MVSMKTLTEQDRKDIEQAYGEMTDKRWNILLAEVAGAEPDDDIVALIADVIANFDEYEAEHDWWQAKLDNK